jgi:lysophospholipase L1-like esterase
VEGLLPGSLALPFHPNARGQAAIAAALLAAINTR